MRKQINNNKKADFILQIIQKNKEILKIVKRLIIIRRVHKIKGIIIWVDKTIQAILVNKFNKTLDLELLWDLKKNIEIKLTFRIIL